MDVVWIALLVGLAGATLGFIRLCEALTAGQASGSGRGGA